MPHFSSDHNWDIPFLHLLSFRGVSFLTFSELILKHRSHFFYKVDCVDNIPIVGIIVRTPEKYFPKIEEPLNNVVSRENLPPDTCLRLPIHLDCPIYQIYVILLFWNHCWSFIDVRLEIAKDKDLSWGTFKFNILKYISFSISLVYIYWSVDKWD